MSVTEVVKELKSWQRALNFLESGDLASARAESIVLVQDLDELISSQLSEVIQSCNFKKLESLWVSIADMTAHISSDRHVQIKIFDISWDELSDHCYSIYDMKQNIIYRRMYQDEINTAGGCPFGMMLVDFQLQILHQDGRGADDFYTVEALSEIGSVCFCPMLVGLHRNFFGDYTEELWFEPKKLKNVIRSSDFDLWKNLRKRESFRYLYLVTPQYKLRPAWKNVNIGFVFNETIKTDQSHDLWGNGIFLLASVVINSFLKNSWFFFLLGEQSLINYKKRVRCDNKSIDFEVVEPELSVSLFVEHDRYRGDIGIVSISTLYLTNQLVLSHAPSAYHVRPNENGIQFSLDINLMVSRFAHYIRVKLRAIIGTVAPELIENKLSQWLNQYTHHDLRSGIKNRQPLKYFSVKLSLSSSSLTAYNLFFEIQPHLYSEFLNAKVILQTTLQK